MMSPMLPAVLQIPHGNSISMERALKQIKELLDLVPAFIDEPAGCYCTIDRVNASIDDVEAMLAAINRG